MNAKSRIEIGIAYIHGRIEAQIEAFAFGIGVPSASLAARVGALLLGNQNGKIVRIEDHMPTLRKKTAKAHTATRKMALVSNASRKPQRKNTYWDRMTPRQRKAEMARRREKGLGYKAA